MTLDEFIEYFRYSTAVGFTFSESQQIANYLKELKVTRKALELACKRLEIIDKKLGGTCQLNSEQFHDSILKKARDDE